MLASLSSLCSHWVSNLICKFLRFSHNKMVRFYQGSDMVLYSFLGQAVYKQFFLYFFGGLEGVGHSFAYVGHLVPVFFRDVWIRTLRSGFEPRKQKK
jgi:hypothetical protein